MDPTGSDSSFNSGGGSPYSAPSSVGDGMLEPVETVTRDAYGQAKYEDKDVLEDDWEFQSDEEQYERDVAALKDGMAQDIDSLIRKGLPSDPAAGLAHAHRGGWSSPQHIPRAQAVASLPVKENMVYEITNLPLDDWGYFSFRVTKPNVRRMVVTLTRLRDDCDPCLFVRRGVRPTQTSYDKCTYQTWSASEREHKLEIDEVRDPAPPTECAPPLLHPLCAARHRAAALYVAAGASGHLPPRRVEHPHLRPARRRLHAARGARACPEAQDVGGRRRADLRLAACAGAGVRGAAGQDRCGGG
jgi:hypothetical protein